MLKNDKIKINWRSKKHLKRAFLFNPKKSKKVKSENTQAKGRNSYAMWLCPLACPSHAVCLSVQLLDWEWLLGSVVASLKNIIWKERAILKYLLWLFTKEKEEKGRKETEPRRGKQKAKQSPKKVQGKSGFNVKVT